MIQFVVEKNGSISSPAIVRSLNAELDTAALNMIQTMPHWIAGKENGIPVRCKYSVPIAFKKPKATVPVDSILQPTVQKKENNLSLQPANLHFLSRTTRLPQPAFTAADSLQLKTSEPHFTKPDCLQPKAKKEISLPAFPETVRKEKARYFNQCILSRNTDQQAYKKHHLLPDDAFYTLLPKRFRHSP